MIYFLKRKPRANSPHWKKSRAGNPINFRVNQINFNTGYLHRIRTKFTGHQLRNCFQSTVEPFIHWLIVYQVSLKYCSQGQVKTNLQGGNAFDEDR